MRSNAGEARRREVVVVLAIWLAAYAVFRIAPVRQLHDSKYTMLLAENILRHHDRDLSRYGLPSDDYRLVTAGARRDRWNVQPDNINANTARLWDWSRPQFLAPLTAAKR